MKTSSQSTTGVYAMVFAIGEGGLGFATAGMKTA